MWNDLITGFYDSSVQCAEETLYSCCREIEVFSHVSQLVHYMMVIKYRDPCSRVIDVQDCFVVNDI
jgi:hypothetical protein